jgi:hypothetical protein
MLGLPETIQRSASDHMAAWENRLSALADRVAAGLGRYRYLLLLLFSAGYLLMTCYRASRKLFWYDELFSLYLARLPDTASLWNALKLGADFNPPLFYILTKFGESLFGEGQIGTRALEIAGFLVFCLCLYRFVASRTSVLAGLISMLFPLVTTAYFYAYDARAHGIVVGFAGLALVCWQQACRQEAIGSKGRWAWLLGLFAALFCADLTHTYAVLLIVPFGIAELVRSNFLKRIDWGLWLALLLSSLGPLISLPQFRIMKSVFPVAFRGSMMANSFVTLLAPSVGVLVAGLILYSIFKFTSPRPSQPWETGSLQLPEVVVLLGFAALPIFTMALSKVGSGPFYVRYCLSTVAGFGCLFGVVAARRAAVGLGVLLCLIAQIAVNQHQFATTDFVPEPTVALPLSTRLTTLTNLYAALDAYPDRSLPIVPLGDHEFLPVLHYAPPRLSQRMIKVVFPNHNDINGECYVPLYKCCSTPGQLETLPQFLAAHDTFLAHCTNRSIERLNYFLRQGAEIKILSAADDSFLVYVNLKRKQGDAAAAPLP